VKIIEAIIKPAKLTEVRSALENMGVEDYMESAISCHGRKGPSRFYRGAEYMTEFVEKVKLEIIASDDAVGSIVQAIGSNARSELRDDCRIFIFPFNEAN